ncbi:hypothetical protein HNY73_008064 [Argiope bruennichi]|uniref:Pre-C2HC domain-containing protein n=1 Tax=Argiope bruennichi TaxID=94029 RepID=A0A8T0F5E5_ARGBR|nr:hypothetical protein HNY73_008064 [Argiope bruennichi]
MLNICRLEAPSLKSSMSSKFLKLTVDTDEEHRRLSRLLEAQGAEFKTFMLRTDRPIKVVIRGLPSCTPIEEIKEDLEREGFTVVSITQLSKFQTKSPMPLFYAQIANGPLSETVYTLTEMFGTKISVERYRAQEDCVVKHYSSGKFNWLKVDAVVVVPCCCSRKCEIIYSSKKLKAYESSSSYCACIANLEIS